MNIRDIIRKQAIAMGMDPTHALTVASIESAFNPRAGNGQYKGLYQMGPQEWDKYGSGDVFDPTDNFNGWAGYQADQTKELTSKLGRPPTPQELYLSHQQGVGGSTALLQNPDLPAVDALAKAYGGKRAPALAAIVANGGAPDMTAAQFADLWKQKYAAKQKEVMGASVDPTDPADIAGLNGGLLGDKFINGPGAGAGPAMAAAPLGDPKADWDLAGYGSSPPMDAVAAASKGGPNFNAMALGGGGALLAAGQPQEQWRPNMQRLPDSPIHKPKLGLLGEINPYGQPIWGRGLLG